MGEVVCFAATWVVAVWATLQAVDPPPESVQPQRTLAISEPLPMVASAVK